MGLNDTPWGERIHIGIIGRTNAGKSSLMNALTGQSMSIVSDTPGTTTDPVSKAMELLPLGPVVLIDTPGLDDESALGSLRVEKTMDALRHCHIAILLIDATIGFTSVEKAILQKILEKKIPYIICLNKVDITSVSNHYGAVNSSTINPVIDLVDITSDTLFDGLVDITNEDLKLLKISTHTGEGIEALKNTLPTLLPQKNSNRLIGDLVESGDVAILVVPIDEAAPKGRLILPQQQTIRDLLESGAVPVVCRDTELSDTFAKLMEKPKVVITDSQAFASVAKMTPKDVYLTSFSILMARYKGDLDWQVKGAKTLDQLSDRDTILISEGCTHHRQCGDIGTVKLPHWISRYTGKDLRFEFTSGGEFPKDLSPYSLIIHCGGCTLNEKEMRYRIDSAREASVPITNYGVAISYMNGILERSLKIFTS